MKERLTDAVLRGFGVDCIWGLSGTRFQLQGIITLQRTLRCGIRVDEIAALQMSLWLYNKDKKYLWRLYNIDKKYIYEGLVVPTLKVTNEHMMNIYD